MLTDLRLPASCDNT